MALPMEFVKEMLQKFDNRAVRTSPGWIEPRAKVIQEILAAIDVRLSQLSTEPDRTLRALKAGNVDVPPYGEEVCDEYAASVERIRRAYQSYSNNFQAFVRSAGKKNEKTYRDYLAEQEFFRGVSEIQSLKSPVIVTCYIEQCSNVIGLPSRCLF